MPVHTTAADIPAPVHTVALLDLGSNSLRMMIAQVGEGGSARIVAQAKQMVRVGEGSFETHVLQPVPMERTLDALRGFAALCRDHAVDTVIALATSAVRDAVNGREFMELIRRETGLGFTVISGKEEARLISLGISSGLESLEGRRIFMDIGGGSTELSSASGDEILALDSLKLGAVRLAELFPEREAGPVSPERYAEMKGYVREHGVLPLRRMREQGALELVGSSGTIQYLADIAAALAQAEGVPASADWLSMGDLRRAVHALCSRSEEERRALPGMDPRVTGILIPGAAILQTVMEELGFERIRISRRGLRDGALADWLARRAAPQEEPSVREASVLRLAADCRFEEEHSRHVSALALMLFDSARELGLAELPGSTRELLHYAALLHDIGIFVSYSRHNEHSAYLIRNGELLGFTEYEIYAISILAFFHRVSYNERSLLLKEMDEGKRRMLRPLSLFLSLAEALDKSHAQSVASVRFFRRGEDRILELTPVRPCTIEKERLKQWAPELESCLGVRHIVWREAERAF